MGMKQHKCAAVILAGGQGSRLGGIDKAGLAVHGRPFYKVIREELEMAGLPVFFSEGAYPAPEEPDLTVIHDLPVPGAEGPIGPMGGILSCFEQTDCELLLFVSCDLPFFHREMAVRLLKRWEEGTDAVVWRTREGRLQPLCGLYARSCVPALRARVEAGSYRLMGFLSELRCLELDTKKEQIPDYWFFNVNSREALEAARGRKPPVLAVSGVKNSGKTTLLERLVGELSARGIRAAVIKHDGHDFEADIPGTDSRRMQDAGACGTVVYSDYRYMAVKQKRGMEARDFFPLFAEADLILLEGQKYSDYPKLELVRRETGGALVCKPETVLAYVTDLTDGEGKPSLPAGCLTACPVFSFDDISAILELTVEYMDRRAVEGGLGL